MKPRYQLWIVMSLSEALILENLTCAREVAMTDEAMLWE